MSELEILGVELRHLLDRAEQWLTEGRSLSLDDDAGQGGDLTEMISELREMRVRSTSSLLNVAFLGGFSSGKSFLIGGLQERLEYAPITIDEDMVTDQYIGLLHSAAKASTACPATVVPVAESADDRDVSGRGYMRVRFEGHDNWEDVGNSPMPGLIAAYTTEDPRAIADWRPAQHRRFKVAEVEIALGSALLPAKLHDLPGHGAPNPEHERIANEAWKTADCFVYTIQATHTLARADLELIARLYRHHRDSGKPVIWVMTGIDRAAMVNYHGQPEWKDALEANNAYLRNEFPAPRGQMDTFIGIDGFMAVSPAWEALGRWHIANGEETKGRKLIAMSRMSRLRDALTAVIEGGVGREHLNAIATEARTHMLRRHQMLTGLLESARLPLNRLAEERDDLSRRLTQLTMAVATIREHLEGDLRDRVNRVKRGFHGLADHLHQELDEAIGEANLTKEEEADRLELRKDEALREWTVQGPKTVWESQFDEFRMNALDLLRETFRESESAADLGAASARVDLEQIKVPPSPRYRTSTQDVVQTISGVVGISAPVVTAIAQGAGIISGYALAIPAGVVVLAGIVYGVARRTNARTTALTLLRKELVDGLGQVADHYRDAFLAAALAQGAEIIARVVELVSERRDELSRKIMLIDRRLAEPEYADRGDLVARLAPHCAAGGEVLEGLRAFTRG